MVLNAHLAQITSRIGNVTLKWGQGRLGEVISRMEQRWICMYEVNGQTGGLPTSVQPLSLIRGSGVVGVLPLPQIRCEGEPRQLLVLGTFQ